MRKFFENPQTIFGDENTIVGLGLCEIILGSFQRDHPLGRLRLRAQKAEEKVHTFGFLAASSAEFVKDADLETDRGNGLGRDDVCGTGLWGRSL